MILATMLSVMLGTSPVEAAPAGLAVVPVVIEATDLDPCANGVVTALKTTGDGFLSVRSSPTPKGREIDRLFNGRTVYTCATRSQWIGIVYGPRENDCGVMTPWVRTLPYTGPCLSGWVHRRWIEIYAG